MHSTALATGIGSDGFGQRLNDYGAWRKNITNAIQAYQEWCSKQSADDSGEELKLYELIDGLRKDTLMIALVGEFSRGKTELINALFFSDYQQRLLPSTPGRTTMCPTEILYDAKTDPCIRLLPIESRKSPLSIADLRKNNVHWTTLPLDLESADQMADALQEIVNAKTVSKSEAHALGLLKIARDEEHPDGDEIEIPVWRHAIVNYPHRLLKQGLVVLDTPGLNALGAEPELTFNMLSQAHAILFVLAADTGVTKTDMDVWKNHVCVATHGHENSRIAALNKIDSLWDELNSEAEVTGFIRRQVEETRRLLEIGENMVFPVSAQKGLIGRIRNDYMLVERSGLLDLEQKLSEDIVLYKQRLIRAKLVAEVGGVVQSSRDVVQNRINGHQTELVEIGSLRGKSSDVIDEITAKLRTQKDVYAEEVQSFQVTRRILSDQVKKLLGRLSMSRFDQLVVKTRKSMRNSWTTNGLRGAMSMFFGSASDDLARVERHADEICKLVESIYQRFHSEHGLPKMKPLKFSVAPFNDQFTELHESSEAFRNSAVMVMTEQHFVIKKFFITVVSRARVIFGDCNQAARSWARSVLTPIYTQIQEHKIMIDRRLENLEKLRDNHASLSERVRNIEAELEDLNEQAALINDILANLEDDIRAESRAGRTVLIPGRRPDPTHMSE